MNAKWYRSPQVLAAVVTAVGVVVAALVTRCEWKTANYSKPSDSKPSSELSVAKPVDQQRRVEVRIFPEIDSKRSQKFRKELRERDGLRPLFVLETSQKVTDAPAKTFFYSDFYYFRISKGKVDSIATSQRYADELSFEVHTDQERNLSVLGFVSKEGAQKLSSMTNKFTLMVFSEPWEDFRVPVLIPVYGVYEASGRRINETPAKTLYVLDVTFDKGSGVYHH